MSQPLAPTIKMVRFEPLGLILIGLGDIFLRGRRRRRRAGRRAAPEPGTSPRKRTFPYRKSYRRMAGGAAPLQLGRLWGRKLAPEK